MPNIDRELLEMLIAALASSHEVKDRQLATKFDLETMDEDSISPSAAIDQDMKTQIVNLDANVDHWRTVVQNYQRKADTQEVFIRELESKVTNHTSYIHDCIQKIKSLETNAHKLKKPIKKPTKKKRK